MNKMIAICGLDCEKCDAYIATKNNDQALREKSARLWSELNNAPILSEQSALKSLPRFGDRCGRNAQ